MRRLDCRPETASRRLGMSATSPAPTLRSKRRAPTESSSVISSPTRSLRRRTKDTDEPLMYLEDEGEPGTSHALLGAASELAAAMSSAETDASTAAEMPAATADSPPPADSEEVSPAALAGVQQHVEVVAGGAEGDAEAEEVTAFVAPAEIIQPEVAAADEVVNDPADVAGALPAEQVLEKSSTTKSDDEPSPEPLTTPHMMDITTSKPLELEGVASDAEEDIADVDAALNAQDAHGEHMAPQPGIDVMDVGALVASKPPDNAADTGTDDPPPRVSEMGCAGDAAEDAAACEQGARELSAAELSDGGLFDSLFGGGSASEQLLPKPNGVGTAADGGPRQQREVARLAPSSAPSSMEWTTGAMVSARPDEERVVMSAELVGFGVDGMRTEDARETWTWADIETFVKEDFADDLHGLPFTVRYRGSVEGKWVKLACDRHLQRACELATADPTARDPLGCVCVDLQVVSTAALSAVSGALELGRARYGNLPSAAGSAASMQQYHAAIAHGASATKMNLTKPVAKGGWQVGEPCVARYRAQEPDVDGRSAKWCASFPCDCPPIEADVCSVRPEKRQISPGEMASVGGLPCAHCPSTAPACNRCHPSTRTRNGDLLISSDLH